MTRTFNVFLSGQRQFGRGALEMILGLGRRSHIKVVGVSAPALTDDRADRLRDLAEQERIPIVEPSQLRADTLPDCDLIVCAHSHAFIGRRTRLKARVGAIGYHPSLLPLHRGRDAVRWTVRDRDRVAGGSVYWLTDRVDAGPLAAQDYCFVRPDDTASSLWRRELYPMGLRLLSRAVRDIAGGRIVQVPQEESLATWEPSWDRPPLHRPDLFLLGDGRPSGLSVSVDSRLLRGDNPLESQTELTVPGRDAFGLTHLTPVEAAEVPASNLLNSIPSSEVKPASARSLEQSRACASRPRHLSTAVAGTPCQ